MKNILLKNVDICTGIKVIENGYVWISNEKIVSVGEMHNLDRKADFGMEIDCYGLGTIFPGMIDVHIHGSSGADVMDGSLDTYEQISQSIVKEGTTAFLATTMTQSQQAIENSLEAVRLYKNKNENSGAELLGVHLEGPFLNTGKRGAQSAEHIIQPNVTLFEKWNELSGELIKLVTMAPEKDVDYELIQYLRNHGIVVSMGHTGATFVEAQRAIGYGVTHATHLFNGMTGIHHRDPGVVGAALLSEKVYTEIILDGHHLTKEIAEIIFRLKGSDKMILITDSIRAKYLPQGEYDLAGQKIHVVQNKVINEEGSLAGSVLKMNEARSNFAKWVCNDPIVLTKITSINPAIQLGVIDRKGTLEKGKDADVILINESGDIMFTICRGVICYRNPFIDKFKKVH